MQETSLRPMDIGSIIDRTFKLYRNNFAAMILFTLLIGGTASFIISLLSLGSSAFQTNSLFGDIYSGLMNGEPIDNILSDFQGSSSAAQSVISSMVAGLLSLLVSVFITPFVHGGVILVTLDVCHGRQEKSRAWFSKTLKLYWKMVGTQFAAFVVALIFIIALMIPVVILLVVTIIGSNYDSGILYAVILIILVIVIMLAMLFSLPYFALIFPVAIHEDKFGFKAMGRTWQLFRRRFWKSIGLVLLVAVIVSVLSSVIELITVLFPPLISTISSVVVNALLTPVSAIAVTLLYLDIRMTVEGYDLELRSAAMNNTQNTQYRNDTLYTNNIPNTEDISNTYNGIDADNTNTTEYINSDNAENKDVSDS